MAEALAKHGQLIKKLDPEYYQLLKSNKKASGKSRKKQSSRKQSRSRKKRK